MSWLTCLPSLDILYILLIVSGFILSSWSRGTLGKGLSLLPFLCLVYLFLELSSAYAAYLFENNHFVYHLFSPVEHFAYGIIFSRLLVNQNARKVVQCSIPIFAFVSILISWMDGLDHTTSKIFVVRALLMLLFCTFYFRELLIFDKALPDRIPAEFWFCVGVTFHFGGRLFIAGLMDALLSRNLHLARSVYYSGYVFNYLFFFIVIFLSFNKNGVADE